MAAVTPNESRKMSASDPALPSDNALQDEEKKIRDLRVRYEELMKDLSPGKRHSRVEVLLLYWDKIGITYLNVEDEVERLRKVFAEKYNYKAQKYSLNCKDAPKRAPSARMASYIANAVVDIDEPNSLLIIYYAGHGNPGKRGELLLTGSNHRPELAEPDTEFAGVIWNEAERLIKNAHEADVLLIFDCCFAGELTNPEFRQSDSHRNFEFLGASNELTRRPGKESFTTALVWALNELSDHPGGFSTSKLCSTIKRAPNFPSKQLPFLSEREIYSSRRLSLAPLSRGFLPEPVKDKENFTHGLLLQLTFDELPSKGDIEKMCKRLRDMVSSGEPKATQINWKALHRKNQSPFDKTMIQVVVERFKILGARRRTRSSLDAKETLFESQDPATVERLSHAASQLPEDVLCESPSDARLPLTPNPATAAEESTNGGLDNEAVADPSDESISRRATKKRKRY